MKQASPRTLRLKKRRFAQVRFNACLRNKLSMVLEAEDTLTTTPLQSESCFTNNFASIYCAYNLSTLLILRITCPNEMLPIFVTCALLSRLLSYLNPSQSRGHVGINPSFLKMLASVFAQPLASQLFLSLSSGQIIDEWHRALVASLRKKGSLLEACNYGLISLSLINCK